LIRSRGLIHDGGKRRRNIRRNGYIIGVIIDIDLRRITHTFGFDNREWNGHLYFYDRVECGMLASFLWFS
jgi:hypothetical protein